MNEPLITVVIPTFRRPDLLQRCLLALAAQSLPIHQFDIIVVDDGNDAYTMDIVHDVAQHMGLRINYLGQPQRGGPAAARNKGWRAAQSPVIAFTDDDCIPHPDWLKAAMKRFEANALVVTGRLKMPLPDRPTAHDQTTALLETAEFITANCFCRRSVLEQAGGFDEAFDIAWREDSALQFAFLRAGIPIESCPEAVVEHPLRPTSWYGPLIDERKNRYDALLYKRYPDLFRKHIPHYPGLVAAYYGIVGSTLVTIGGALVGNQSLIRTGRITWFLLTVGLLAHRQVDQPLKELPKNALTSAICPFLSIYWRLYGAVKHQVWYW